MANDGRNSAVQQHVDFKVDVETGYISAVYQTVEYLAGIAVAASALQQHVEYSIPSAAATAIYMMVEYVDEIEPAKAARNPIQGQEQRKPYAPQGRRFRRKAGNRPSS